MPIYSDPTFSWGVIFVIPNILCDARGVIVSHFEWLQSLQRFFWNETEGVEALTTRKFMETFPKIPHVP
jgi:glutamate dehydrogenase/leucine dehydrogenase